VRTNRRPPNKIIITPERVVAELRASGGGGGGADGASGAVVFLFKRSASAPSVPSATSTLTFATGVLTGHDNGWSQSVPTADGNPLYVITASASASTATVTIGTGEWSTPAIMAQDGADGTDGTDGVDGTDGADGAAWTVYPVTVTTARQMWVESVVSHPGMTSSATLRAWLRAGLNSDENTADMMPGVIVTATPGTDQVTLTLVSPIPMSGPVKVTYEVLG
jgi:hypothetical protein